MRFLYLSLGVPCSDWRPQSRSLAVVTSQKQGVERLSTLGLFLFCCLLGIWRLVPDSLCKVEQKEMQCTTSLIFNDNIGNILFKFWHFWTKIFFYPTYFFPSLFFSLLPFFLLFLPPYHFSFPSSFTSFLLPSLPSFLPIFLFLGVTLNMPPSIRRDGRKAKWWQAGREGTLNSISQQQHSQTWAQLKEKRSELMMTDLSLNGSWSPQVFTLCTG